MEKMYELMEKSLELEKQLASFIYVMSCLEQSYSEEIQAEEKYLTNTMLSMLLTVQKNVKCMIHEMDGYIVETKKETSP